MVATNAWNRLHNLSAPPPARQDRLLPNAGCQPCLASRACPYREQYACSDADRAEGTLHGRCAVEAQFRLVEELAWRSSWQSKPACGREKAEALLALLLDAATYALRSSAWMAVVAARRPKGTGYMDGPEEVRAIARYRADARLRVLRRVHDMRLHLEAWRRMYDPKPAAAAGAGPRGGRTQPPGRADDEEELPNLPEPGWAERACQGAPDDT